VTALPVNGGTYNLLLNTTSKANASIAACLTMLSYVVTAVISATSAMRYIHTLCEGDGCVAIGNDVNTSVIFTTLITLSFAGFLSIMGISESAIVALGIFFFHMLSMFTLVIASLYTAFTSMPTVDVQIDNYISSPILYNYSLSKNLLPIDASSCECINSTLMNLTLNTNSMNNTLTEQVPMIIYNWVYTTPAMGIGGAIFFGYSSALLGISGFESSSNYVENQKPGVFPKTLRNMWVAVTFINPSIAFLAQCLLPVDEIAGQAEEGALLSLMAMKAAGNWLKVWIVIDATLVLVGAVITGFVGFTGLVHRMTVDRCLPQGFLKVNECRKTRHIIIGFYWFLTSALVLYTWGNVEVLAGVYTVAFLSVMFSFTVGNMLLKLRRSTLPTPVHVEWSIVLLANVCVAAGLIGNVISRPRSLPSLLIFGAVFILPVIQYCLSVFFSFFFFFFPPSLFLPLPPSSSLFLPLSFRISILTNESYQFSDNFLMKIFSNFRYRLC
jgi:amino acid transporter